MGSDKEVRLKKLYHYRSGQMLRAPGERGSQNLYTVNT
jgi:hypothetical protein